ncbi:MAG: response regulator [Bdellovibrionaceae bacterium]|nr:response regulator [Pseudobdellovibrionaceae bacterium]
MLGIEGLFIAALFLSLAANGFFVWRSWRNRERFARREDELRREFEVELAARQRLLLETQSIAKLGSWEWDIPTDKITWSEQLYKIFEVDPSNFDASYGAYLDRLKPEYRERITSAVQRARETGESYIVEHAAHHSDGSVHYIQSRGIAVRDDQGRVVKLMGTCQDITKQKSFEESLKNAHEDLEARVRERTQQLWEALERERMAKEAKMTFLANMSHEIRTPMNAILGFSNLLLDQQVPAEHRALLGRIKTNGDHLLQLIDDILDLSKFEAGRIPVEKEDLNLPHLLQEVVNSVSSLAAKKGLSLAIVYETLLPEKVQTDGLRLRQIITNLLSNAIKFSEEGQVTIKVAQREKPFARGTSMLSVEVHDTGIGIHPEDQGKLFQPFTQGDNSGTRRFGGTGLGLALSRHIARALDGELILVASLLGKGSCFRLTLEMAEMPAPRRIALIGPGETLDFAMPAEATAVVASPASLSPTLPPCRILLAEDSPDNEDLIRMYLRAEGVVIESAANGEIAVEMALKNHYDIVLMDVQMPVMDGLEATRRLRARGYSRPILALTAHAMKEDHDRSIKAGCSGHLTKPIQKTELILSIQHELMGHHHDYQPEL